MRTFFLNLLFLFCSYTLLGKKGLMARRSHLLMKLLSDISVSLGTLRPVFPYICALFDFLESIHFRRTHLTSSSRSFWPSLDFSWHMSIVESCIWGCELLSASSVETQLPSILVSLCCCCRGLCSPLQLGFPMRNRHKYPVLQSLIDRAYMVPLSMCSVFTLLENHNTSFPIDPKSSLLWKSLLNGRAVIGSLWR